MKDSEILGLASIIFLAASLSASNIFSAGIALAIGAGFCWKATRAVRKEMEGDDQK